MDLVTVFPPGPHLDMVALVPYWALLDLVPVVSIWPHMEHKTLIHIWAYPGSVVSGPYLASLGPGYSLIYLGLTWTW